MGRWFYSRKQIPCSTENAHTHIILHCFTCIVKSIPTHVCSCTHAHHTHTHTRKRRQFPELSHGPEKLITPHTAVSVTAALVTMAPTITSHHIISQHNTHHIASTSNYQPNDRRNNCMVSGY